MPRLTREHTLVHRLCFAPALGVVERITGLEHPAQIARVELACERERRDRLVDPPSVPMDERARREDGPRARRPLEEREGLGRAPRAPTQTGSHHGEHRLVCRASFENGERDACPSGDRREALHGQDVVLRAAIDEHTEDAHQRVVADAGDPVAGQDGQEQRIEIAHVGARPRDRGEQACSLLVRPCLDEPLGAEGLEREVALLAFGLEQRQEVPVSLLRLVHERPPVGA